MLPRRAALRRRMEPEPLPRRRRAWLVVFAVTVLIFLLLAAWFTTAFLRQAPPVDPRWAQAPDAVAILRIRWEGEQRDMIREPFFAWYRNQFGPQSDPAALWSAANFLLCPEMTLWLFPGESEERQVNIHDTSNTDAFSWIAFFSLRRRERFLTSRFAAALDSALQGESSSRSDSPGGIRADVTGGALTLGTAAGRFEAISEMLGRASRLPRGRHPSPDSIDPLWKVLPSQDPLEFALREPGEWILRMARRLDPRAAEAQLRPVTSSLFPSGAILRGFARRTPQGGALLEARWAAPAPPDRPGKREMDTLAEWLNTLAAGPLGEGNAKITLKEDREKEEILLQMTVKDWGKASAALFR